MTPKLIVVALGGNALARRGEPMTAETQRANVRRAVTALAPLLATGHRLVITHGNGPQVGLLALQAAAGPKDGLYPLDILDAESEGMIGYVIELELRNAAPPGYEFATLLTQVLVEPGDPAFLKPTKPIGPMYDEAQSRELSALHGYVFARDGNGWRRVVASPRPCRILEASVIASLAEAGVTVICTGGGGIPVARDVDGRLAGVEAVVDKDLASSLLARGLKADHLLLLTDVPGVFIDWGTLPGRLVARAGPGMLDPARFPPGSMGPKLEAANEFVAATTKPASIGRLEDAELIFRGLAGTAIEASVTQMSLRT
jgi:carbamate kinase